MKKTLCAIALITILFSAVEINSMAAEIDLKDDFSKYGINSIEIDSTYIVITRDNVYNADILDEESIKALTSNMINNDIYLIASPSSGEYEIDIVIRPGNEYYDIKLLKYTDPEELVEKVNDSFNGEFVVKSVDIIDNNHDIPFVIYDGDLPNINQSLISYCCSTNGDKGNYLVNINLYTVGRAAKQSERKELERVVNSLDINIYESEELNSLLDELTDNGDSYTDVNENVIPEYNNNASEISQSEAVKKVASDRLTKLIFKFIFGGIGGGIIAAIAIAISCKKKRNKIEIESNINTNIVESQIVEKDVIKADGTDKTVFDKDDEINNSERTFCRKCGNELAYDSAFCNKCGTKVKKVKK